MTRDAESSRKVLGPIAIRLTAATPGEPYVCRAESGSDLGALCTIILEQRVYNALPMSPSTLRTGFQGITNLA
ncbi:hypothetical protein BD311DRAFT_760254 [Dichomitus squalens]|uniref:Uncharacterized protein n=1 Tax=Dichomitus squalens TaxID=114155 RepID=A0A4Q9MJE5_9APHY|nr:hypothetical protein BD311DRAFT_760254 [Dichomitus squalens]